MQIYKQISKLILAFSLSTLFFMNIAQAAANDSPIGLWKTFDDRTHEATSIVEVSRENGRFSGKVVELFGNQNAVCSKCNGDLHDKPILGMTVLSNFIPQDGGWGEGKVLAVKRGRFYNATLNLQNQGDVLQIVVQTALGAHAENWERVAAKR